MGREHSSKRKRKHRSKRSDEKESRRDKKKRHKSSDRDESSRKRKRSSKSEKRSRDKDKKRKREERREKDKPVETEEERKLRREEKAKEEELERYGEEIVKRRERLQEWREKKNKEVEEKEKQLAERVAAWKDNNAKQIKAEEEGPVPMVGEAPQEEDPLDAYMQDIHKEVQKLHKIEVATIVGQSGTKVRKLISQNGNQQQKTKNVIRSTLGVRYYADDEEEWKNFGKDTDSYLDKKKKTRAIPAVDHAAMNYEPFKKNFYIEVPAITKMTNEEVAQYRREHLEGVRVRGRRCPKPIKEFSQCGLSSKMYSVMKHYNYNKPTPIQAQAIPAVMKGRDLIGCAKTGSGKTLAFLLPMLRHVMAQRRVEQGEGPIGLVMAPTRELALQIYNEYKKFCKPLSLRVVCVFGGSGVADQIAKLKRGAEIVVCTPGRMIDILCTNNGRICNMARVTFLVLDEADRMFDLGFEPQVMRIVENIRPGRQTVMFSATFPLSVENVAKKILHKPLEIIVGGRSTVCADVEQHVEIRSEDSKFNRLIELLTIWQDRGSILIFVDTKDSVDEMYGALVKRKMPVLALHGDHDQADRADTINEFKKGTKTILVATSVISRGLDIPELNLVINYDCPNHLEEYVHRVGRTGRAGNKGWAYTFLTPEEDKYAPDLVKALKDSGSEVPAGLNAMANAYKTKKTAGLALSHGSGFGGKGYLFNEAEANKKMDSIRIQKKAMGLEEESDSEEASDEEEVDNSMALALTGDDQEVAASLINSGISQTAAQILKNLPPSAMALLNPSAQRSVTEQALQQVYTNLPGQAPSVIEAARKAALFSQVLTMNKNMISKTQAGNSEYYTAELEINDYPQQSRWKVTHKDALYQITEMTGAAITTRGNYIKPGAKISPGERKLYLFIEGPSENAVKRARAEIKRILEDTAALSHNDRGGRSSLW